MPLIILHTNQPIADEASTSLLTALTHLASKHLNKPKEYVQVLVHPSTTMTFAGTAEPTAWVEVRSLGLPEGSPQQLTEGLCQILEDELGIPPARVFANFMDMPRTHWGWDRRTFG